MEEHRRRHLQSLYLAGEREIPSGMVPEPKTKKTSGAPSASPAKSTNPEQTLEAIRLEIGDCTRCRLAKGRTNIVFGVGNPKAKLMFIGEAPGRDEDLRGEPFVGAAGKLLTKIIEAMSLSRNEVYIANVVKCRPPENRNPAPDEISTCGPFLLRQIETIQPKIIVALGNFAVQTLLQTESKISGLRGHFHPWPSAVAKEKFGTTLQENSIKVMPTYHPAFLLRNPAMKRPVWEDMQKVMEKLGLTSPKS